MRVVGEGSKRWVLHVDMDAFFAAVEALDDPTLAGKPVIVGGEGRRGVVASCSYEARAFGVRSAMPSVEARRLCPGAVFVAPRHGRYAQVSRQLHEVFAGFTPIVEGISLDEAFLDVTGAERIYGPPATIGALIRRRVFERTGLVCSVGGSRVKFVAKMASKAAKPHVPRTCGKPSRSPALVRPPGPAEVGDGGGLADGGGPGSGVFIIPEGQEIAFLHPHPVEALWGVGPATSTRLARMGIKTVGDLASVPPRTLEEVLGRANGAHLARLARAVDDRAVLPERETKSISQEETFSHDRFDVDSLRVPVLGMADSVSSRVRQAGLRARTVTVKVRYRDMTTRTRSHTLRQGTDASTDIATAALSMLADAGCERGVRLVGVSLTNLAEPAGTATSQLSLNLGGETQKTLPPRSAPGAVVDEVRRRFGPESLTTAALVGPARRSVGLS